MMHRRTLLAALAAPGVARAQTRTDSPTILRFVPQADLAVVDPHFNVAFVTRNHANLVYDVLFGVDANGAPSPQMAAGHTVEDDGRLWTITLRDGLRFHDGTPVLARDVVASLKRWAARDTFARSTFADIEELTAPSDSIVRFRLRRPFRLLADLLGKPSPVLPAIMPERVARTPITEMVSEIVGSGPYQFVANERVAGSRNVYRKFDGYIPRPGGPPVATAGPKIAHFERIEWLTIPDQSTAIAALQSGEVDWVEQPAPDLLPLLRRNPAVKVEVADTSGFMALLRLNHLTTPFDNPAIRRAIIGAFSQSDMMTAVAGDDRALWFDRAGFFHPSSPLATQAGLERLNAPPDYAAIRRDLVAAGYKGEVVRLVAPTDLPAINAMSEVAADVFRKIGMTLDYASTDWGTAIPWLNNKKPTAQGGWSATCNYAPGFAAMNPAAHGFLRCNGAAALFGWPSSDQVESLRAAWIEASDLAEQKRLAEQLQRAALEVVPYIPLGGFYFATAYRSSLTGLIRGPAPMFYNVRRA